MGNEESEYLTDNGYYSIPKHVWNKLDDEEKRKFKTHNASLWKKRKKSDESQGQYISHRQLAGSNTDHQQGENAKKMRTVEFQDDGEQTDHRNQDVDDKKEVT